MHETVRNAGRTIVIDRGRRALDWNPAFGVSDRAPRRASRAPRLPVPRSAQDLTIDEDVVDLDPFAQLDEELSIALEMMHLGWRTNLPLRYREVLLLVSVEGFENAQVGAMLELEPVTVRQRLSRARAMLRKAIDCEEER